MKNTGRNLRRISGLRVLAIVLAAIFVAVLGAGMVQAAALLQNGENFALDFRVFWNAAQLAIDGAALDAFDQSVAAAANARPNANLQSPPPWLYPPTWLLLVLPFGYLSLLKAWILFSALSLGALFMAFSYAKRAYATDCAMEITAIWLFSPAVLISLMLGQTSVLWTAGLVAAVAALQLGRQAASGVILALLTFKPQLGVLIPAALIAGRKLKTILVAIVAALCFACVATMCFGLEYWGAMWTAIQRFSAEIATGTWRFNLVSAFGLLHGVGADHTLAITLHIAVMIIAAVAVYAVWRTPGASPALRASTLCFAVLLGPHYLHAYELTTLSAAGFFLSIDDRERARFPSLLFVLFWMGPALGLTRPDILPLSVFGAPLSLIGLGVACRRLRKTQ